MKFTATQTWTTFANATAKELHWNCYVRKTTSVSSSLTTGTWIDATSHIVEMGNPSTNIEFEYGQFTADSLSITGHDIAWWNSNVFNAGDTEYVELKYVCNLKMGSTETTDNAIVFSGFVDKTEVTYSEVDDTVSFDVYTIDEQANRIAAEYCTTQYLDTNISGSGKTVLVLPNITSVYVSSSNMGDYPLRVGTHTITYENINNPVTRSLKLDDGEPVSITGSNETYVLSNGGVGEYDIQQVKVYVKDYSLLPLYNTEVKEEVVVLNDSDTLPYQWYKHRTTRNIITLIYNKMGITDITFGDIDYPTNDSTNVYSVLDSPPVTVDSAPIYSTKQAMVSDGTDLYVAVDNGIYKRSMVSQSYELLTTLPTPSSTTIVPKMWYNSRNNDLWFVYGTGSNYDNATNNIKRVGRYNITTDTLVTTQLSGTVWYNSMDVVDKLYADPEYYYRFMYVDGNAGRLYEVSSSMRQTTVDSSGELMNNHAFWSPNASTFYACKTGSFYKRWTNDGSGWTISTQVSRSYDYIHAGFNQQDGRIYFEGASSLLRYAATGSGTSTLISGYAYANNFIYQSDGYVYASMVKNNTNTMIRLRAGSATDLFTEPRLFYTYNIPDNNSYTVLGTTLYGIDRDGLLWKFDDSITPYIAELKATDLTLKDLLNQVLRSANLVSVINSNKRAYVYKRNDINGTHSTTGNTVTFTTNNLDTVSKVASKYGKVKLVSVSNDDVTYSYNGTAFGTSVLSDAQTFQMSNNFTTSELCKELAYYIYQYLSVDKSSYTITTANCPLFQYEPLDTATFTLPNTKIATTSSGIIYKVTYNVDGSMEVEVII